MTFLLDASFDLGILLLLCNNNHKKKGLTLTILQKTLIFKMKVVKQDQESTFFKQFEVVKLVHGGEDHTKKTGTPAFFIITNPQTP